jgi:hypothetical protein
MDMQLEKGWEVHVVTYNLMLNSGKKIRTLLDKINKYSNSCVVRKKILNETKNHTPPAS